MSPPKLADRDLLVLILFIIVIGAVLIADVYVEWVNPTQSFVDFAVLFGIGWGMYLLGKMPPS